MTRQTSPTYRSTAKLKVCKETFLPKCCYQMRIGYITCVIYNTPDNLRIALEDNFDHSIFTVRIGVASAMSTVGNVRVMNARLRKEKRHQSQQPPVNSLQIRRTTI